jgi:nucleoside-diphosphate-sugar epimerase
LKLFVTGATGFIGSHFVNHAHEAGHELVCLRRTGSNPRIEIVKEPKWVEGSMEDNWREVLGECDVLIHLASHSTNVPYDTLENCLYWNLTVPLKLFQQARESGIEKYIIAGTGFEYGLSGERYEEIPIDAPLEPTMTYPASKAAASVAFSQWSIEHQLQLKYLRIFQVFGEGEAESRLWPSLRKAALSGEDFHLTLGEQIRDFTPVEEIAKQLVEELDFSTCKKGEPFLSNVSAGTPQSMREFSEFWWKIWGATGKLHFGSISYRKNEVMRFVPLIRKNESQDI